MCRYHPFPYTRRQNLPLTPSLRRPHPWNLSPLWKLPTIQLLIVCIALTTHFK